MTNHPKSFYSSSIYETGLSNFHKLTLTVSKVFHAKHKHKVIQYGDFYHFDNASIRTDFLKKLSTQNGQFGEFEKF